MKTRATKPRIALFGMAVLGGGTLGQGIPVLHDLFTRLSENYTIDFYCFQHTDSSRVPSGIRVHQVVSLPIPGRLKYLLLLLRFALNHIRNPYRLIFSIAIYPTGKAALLAKRIFKIPVVVQIIALEAVALEDIGRGNLTVPWLRKITQQVCKETDELVAVADYQSRMAKTSLPTLRDIVVLPLRINHLQFNYKRRELSTPIKFINIGYYGPVKDQHTMFDAFARIARDVESHLTVIGEGFDVPEVKELLVRLDITNKVTFTGFLHNHELPKHLDHAHILLHTARFETGCAVIQEAMASGAVVAGTDVGILADIGDKYAIIVPPKDAEGLAKKILELLQDPARYEAIRESAYAFISTYNATWAYENYRDFIGKLVSRK